MDPRVQHLGQQVELAFSEARQAQARADHFGLRVTTRAYLERRTTDGAGRQLTDRELELDELQTQASHIELAEQHLARAKRLLKEQQMIINALLL